MWVYKSPVGNLYIKKLPNGTYGLEYDGIIYETSPSPQIEADNVFNQSTGTPWDNYNLFENPINVPIDLSEWEKV